MKRQPLTDHIKKNGKKRLANLENHIEISEYFLKWPVFRDTAIANTPPVI